MFIAIYEFEVKAGRVEVFRHAWFEVTKYLHQYAGSLGSRLHDTQQPEVLLAYAQWPDEESWCTPKEIEDPNYHYYWRVMKDCLVASRTLHKLTTNTDYLQQQPFEN
ncbi:antibiotic biosynthesis monooxygenase family protein [Vibrio hippocampi]|uniref:ABM domain-containing protein n=1 Tax=Vibrio hippocampi TaxID=654686 RepID=A0ABN8DI99_9VIBR|nr:antibiotic biosynthesis monooxygenase [Vibrio hippocampi]CAH0528775.1 hypothetical protein VHP8226_02802 [Vibrio hippocampi]